MRSSNNKNKIKKKGVAPYLLKSMLIKTWQHLRQPMMLRRRKHARQTKRTTPAGDISKVGRVLEQNYINYNFSKKLRKRTFKLKEALLGRSEPDYLWTRKD